MPPIGNADHDIVYAECSLTLKRKKKPTRKVYKYNKINWVNMNKDIIKITENITSQYETISRKYSKNSFLIPWKLTYHTN